jgi:hypothetical protein
MQYRLREKASREYYCWIGILLACMAIILAIGLGPEGVYHRDANAFFGMSKYSIQKTNLADNSISSAKP